MDKQMVMAMVEKVKGMSVPLSERSLQALSELENPHYTITLTGEFQVGKSTLLNKVMLGTEVLLKEGKGLPTTAIPCKVVYAPEKKLTVVYREASKPEKQYLEPEITEELLQSLTTATNEDARTALAKEIRYVRLELPVEAIKAYTFFDTPGVDDPNTELIERTTAETLPESDIVLMVVDASKTLSSKTMDYLSNAIFSAGMSRVMILASYKPQFYLMAEERAAILSTIRAQLASIGREYVPVVSYTYDETVEGDILRGPEEIMAAILRYIEANRETARVDRLAYALSRDVMAHVETQKALLAVSGKSEQEIEALELKVEAVARSLDAQYNQTVNDFLLECSTIQNELEDTLRGQLLGEENPDSALNLFMTQIEQAKDATEVNAMTEAAVARVSRVVQSRMVECAAEFKRRMEVTLMRVSECVAVASDTIVISSEYEGSVSGGWLGRINPHLLKAFTVGGALLVSFPLAALLIFVDKIPILKALAPGNILKHMILKSYRKTLDDSLTTALGGFLDQMKLAVAKIKEQIGVVYEGLYEEKIKPYHDVIATERGKTLDIEAQEKVKAFIDRLIAVCRELSV